MIDPFQIERSWATRPLLHNAPHPASQDPRKYQFAGVEYALQRRNALIGDAPGLGKSCQGVLISNSIRAERTLIVCPASLRLNWQREVWKWSTVPNVSTYPVLTAKDGINLAADYTIISYDLLRNPNLLAAILDGFWDHVILDEAHYLKDPKGNQRTAAIFQLPQVVGRFTMLSGTITPNQPLECLEADTLVLTNRGWVAIIDVVVEDLLWDGEQWVNHEGLADRGQKNTIRMAGVGVTPDHEIFLGDGWSKASDLRGSTLSQALVIGLENLPSQKLFGGQRGVYGRRGSSAIVDIARLKQTLTSWLLATLGSAGLVEPWKGYGTIISNIRRLYRMIKRGLECFSLCKIVSSDVNPITGGTLIMANGGSAFTNLGLTGGKAELPSLNISLVSKTGICKGMSWTVLMFKGIISRVIFGLFRIKIIPATGERLDNFKSELTSLKPVYDLVNAGPRHRFTILTNRGPMIVHNCLNAFRLLDWSAIGYMNEEDFRENYYTIGEGFVNTYHSVKLSNGETVRKRETHWSQNVRNVPVNMDDLRQRLRSSIMVRRLKEHVLPELPPMQWHPFPLEMTPGLRKTMRGGAWARAEKLWELDPDNFDPTSPFDGEVATAWRELGEAKAPAVAAYARELHEEGADKIVIGAWNLSVLAMLVEALKPWGVAYMDGSTSPKNKDAAAVRFQEDPDCHFIIGQVLPLGEGWNLTAAQDVIIAQPLPNPGKNYQLLERVNRFGQLGDYTLGHLPIVPNSLDERWIARAIERDRVIYQMLDAPEA